MEVCSLGEERYHFEVIDTGPGIPTARQEEIFHPFQQETAGSIQGGTGLGLAIARRHVGLLGGELTVDSQPGQGARFQFTALLPRGELTSPEPDPWSRVQRVAEGCAVEALIVDDVTTNRDILEQVLQRVGVATRMAAGGQEALDMVARQLPDIIFMDIRMPGMDGVEARRRLVEEHGAGTVKIVAVSASVFDHERRAYMEQGFDDFIDKPLRTEEIYRCLADQLGVEFVYGEDVDTDSEPDWGEVELPTAIIAKLRIALDDHSVSDLNRHLDELDALGEPAQNLVRRLREQARRFDLKAVEETLTRFQQPEPGATDE
jgi:CheY-like chemotaxis protein